VPLVGYLPALWSCLSAPFHAPRSMFYAKPALSIQHFCWPTVLSMHCFYDIFRPPKPPSCPNGAPKFVLAFFFSLMPFTS
jgi:hypothetical protein